MLLLATQAANTAAKIAKTKATISKINHFIMMRYDSYRTRRLALNIASYVTNPTSYNFSSKTYSHPNWYTNTKSAGAPTPADMARARLNAIRDLMRMEMPDRWTDIAFVSSSGAPVITGPLLVDPALSQMSPPPVPAPPVLTQRYFNALLQGYSNNKNVLPALPPAQCLYMVVMSDSEAPHQFGADEIGTVDASGLPVFVDGWGHAIMFLRWPVGFLPPGNPINSAIRCDTDLQSGNATTDHDPFDPHGVTSTTWTGFENNVNANNFQNSAYTVYPLVYSAGPDGALGINVGADSNKNPLAYPWGHNGQSPGQLDQYGNFDPYQTDLGGLLAGQPDGTLFQFDNIHNQRVEAK
jgi:hypothetical protein